MKATDCTLNIFDPYYFSGKVKKGAATNKYHNIAYTYAIQWNLCYILKMFYLCYIMQLEENYKYL